MKYCCADCEKIFEEKDIIMVGVGTGWNFYTVTILCNNCFKFHKNKHKPCFECRYFKTWSRHEQCEDCKGHCNWEEKPLS